MTDVQNWIDQLDPMAAFFAMGGAFLIVSVAGWYVGDVILWLRKGV
jgi:hypothetical protein